MDLMVRLGLPLHLFSFSYTLLEIYRKPFNQENQVNQDTTFITIAIEAYGSRDITELLQGFSFETISIDYLAGNSLIKTISIHKDAVLTTMTRIVTDLENTGGVRMVAVDSPECDIIIGYFDEPEGEWKFADWVRQHFNASKPVFNLTVS